MNNSNKPMTATEVQERLSTPLDPEKILELTKLSNEYMKNFIDDIFEVLIRKGLIDETQMRPMRNPS